MSIKEPVIGEQRIKDLVSLVIDSKFKIALLEKEPRAIKKVIRNQEVVEETKEFKNIFTEFIINELVKTPEQTSNFLKLVYSTFDSALKLYIASYKLPADSIIFLYKGGNILRFIFQEITKELPFSVSEKIEEFYRDAFKKSDMDFSIYIDPRLPNYDKIYEDVCNLTFLLENQIRNEFIANLSFYFEFFRLNGPTQKSILEVYLNKLNDTGTVKEKKFGFDGKFTGIVFGDIKIGTDEDYVTKDDAETAFINRETQDENFTVKLHYLHNINSSDPILKRLIEEEKPLYIKNSGVFASTNEISFNKGMVNTFFNLIRIKWAVNIIFDKANENIQTDVNSDVKELKGGSQKMLKVDGEIIDVTVIGKSDSYVLHFFESIKENVSKYQITSLEFNAYSFTYLIEDLEKILFKGSEFPWNDTKYAKRIKRLLFMYFLLILLNFPAMNDKGHDARINYIKNVKVNIFDKIVSGIDNEQIELYIKGYLENTLIKPKTMKKDPFKDLIKNVTVLLLNPNTDKNELVKYSTVVVENLNKMIELIDLLNHFIQSKGMLSEEQLLTAQTVSGGYKNYYEKYKKYKLKHLQFKQ